MSKPNILLAWPYTDRDTARLEDAYTVHRLWEMRDRAEFLGRVGPTIRALATDGECGASAQLIDALPNLELIASFGVGLDAIDLQHAWSRGIRVTHTPDVLTGDVADMGMALLLACVRRIPGGDAHVRSGKWPQGSPALTTRVFGKRLGILGLGRVGRAVAKRAAAFDLEISYHDRTRHADVPYQYCPDPVSLAAESDFLMICAAADRGNRGLVGEAVLKALGRHGFLINIARGSIVDEPVLIDYLQRNLIAGAALDVFWNEPHISPVLRTLDNLVLQAHQASATEETRAAMGALVLDNLVAHFSCAPLLTEVAPPKAVGDRFDLVKQ